MEQVPMTGRPLAGTVSGWVIGDVTAVSSGGDFVASNTWADALAKPCQGADMYRFGE